MAKKPETFRCSETIKDYDGKRIQCPCEFTLANAAVYTMRSLDRKAKDAGLEMADLKFLVQHAICPFHARLKARIQRDVVRMEGVLDLMMKRENSLRESHVYFERKKQLNDRHNSRYIAQMPGLGAALTLAGFRPSSQRKTSEASQ